MQAAFFEWMLDCGRTRADPISPDEQRALRLIDGRLRGGGFDALLTRVPAGIPRLLAALRDEGLAADALVEQVARDLLLTAEVLRLAGSAHYRTPEQPPVAGLGQAIAVLGRSGLRRAVAAVLLRPMFDVQAGALTQRSAQRLWEHAERKAQLCAELAEAQGLDRFDGYLAGLAHNTGWSAAWRLIDRQGEPLPLPCSVEFAQEMRWRRDRLFGALVATWQIAPALTMLGVEAHRTALANVQSPLGPLLLEADRLATVASIAPPVAADAEPIAA